MGKDKKYKFYTDEENNILRKYYPSADWNELLKMLPDRNKASITKQANKMGLKRNSRALSIDKVKDLIKDKPYKMIEETFSTLSNGFIGLTDEGYKVVVSEDNIYRNKTPEIFHKNNPYTIENINKYLENNHISTKLLSVEYFGSSKLLEWECSCGEHFKTSWNNFLSGKHTCNKCSLKQNGINNRIPYDEIKSAITDAGYKILDIDESIPLSAANIEVKDVDGYYYVIHWYDFINGKSPSRFGRNNPYTIQNINKYLELTNRSDYRCISTEYINNTSNLEFLHIPCGTVFKSNLSAIQGEIMRNSDEHWHYKKCPVCEQKMIESAHASALKQVFVHEYPDTILEDASCINPETGRSLPTDIVNHRLKIAIEVQSQFHDSDWRKERDEFKRNFWINKGYTFYDPDIRDYSILGLIQIFFPMISKIPEYIHYDFSKCKDFTMIQDYLDHGYTIAEISKITGIKKGTIQGMVHNKKIILPDGYKEKVLNIRPVVRLDLDGNYMATFQTIMSVQEAGCNPSMVSKVLKGKRNLHHNSYWIYESDYLSGNYHLQKS